MPAPPVTESELASVKALVRRRFGFTALREGQAETLVRVLRGEDVLAVLPTGGGKSVLYQLPAFEGEGVTVVVSPLIALMKDQLDSLPSEHRAKAVALTSELPPREIRRVLDEVADGVYRLLYVAPERLRQPTLLRALRRAGVDRLVVDEAHCVSVWGHDFRPDYLAVGEARRALGDPPLLAVTATAPPRVERDIVARLGDLAVVRASVDRPNLRWEAVLAADADEKLGHLLRLCREERGQGVVYARSRARCEQLATGLAAAGVDAAPYHAGLPDRALVQEAFMRGETHVLVATVAFGMGIDKRDVRFVFHIDPPSSLENYYQEAGRAGRDGAPARCVVLATGADAGTLKQRAKADLPSAALVERVWGLLLAGAGPDGVSVVDPDALDSLGEDADDPKPRVALSVLVEAGAAERLGEVPRFLRLEGGDPALAAFRGREASVFEVAQALGVAPQDVEGALLERVEGGRVAYRVSGRALLHRVTGDTSRVEDVLARYLRTAEERAKEMMDYARATTCRRAVLCRHFGETDVPSTCGNCDVCLGIRHEPDEPTDDRQAARAVLAALAAVRGLGETNLVYLLRGDARTSDYAAENPAFGALAFRSEAKVKSVVRALEAQGLVERETLPHGGAALRITARGADALGGRVEIGSPASRAAARGGGAPRTAPQDEPDLAPEERARFEALKAWRRGRADAEGVPAYVVAHDATLRELARKRPTTTAELREVKGFGPKKVEKYGAEVLAALADGSA